MTEAEPKPSIADNQSQQTNTATQLCKNIMNFEVKPDAKKVGLSLSQDFLMAVRMMELDLEKFANSILWAFRKQYLRFSEESAEKAQRLRWWAERRNRKIPKKLEYQKRLVRHVHINPELIEFCRPHMSISGIVEKHGWNYIRKIKESQLAANEPSSEQAVK
jgi:hypothetical protein